MTSLSTRAKAAGLAALSGVAILTGMFNVATASAAPDQNSPSTTNATLPYNTDFLNKMGWPVDGFHSAPDNRPSAPCGNFADSYDSANSYPSGMCYTG
jgi:hypothetical protein